MRQFSEAEIARLAESDIVVNTLAETLDVKDFWPYVQDTDSESGHIYGINRYVEYDFSRDGRELHLVARMDEGYEFRETTIRFGEDPSERWVRMRTVALRGNLAALIEDFANDLADEN